jgi:RHH-type proline utilization regulon transcriptional repressor/proline dehydrogenase/delta 1-pyrroline-5-carboxylate dehydrogenase
MALTFSRVHDPTGIPGEDNLLRYQPCSNLLIRLGAGCTGEDTARVLLATVVAGVPCAVSAHPEAAVGAVLNVLPPHVPWLREGDDDLAGRLPSLGHDRVRALGALSTGLRSAIHALPIPLVEAPAVAHGSLELHRVFKEQSLTIAYHRYGNLGVREPPS